ncbi:MAG: SpaH/EbpB family LPXTG-anchored major pilin [Lachnospiraceae bacterium]|nr:SpaH/EbpB family LPXTG-anchored major pilin [Lachnospiraceae bacterium]
MKKMKKFLSVLLAMAMVLGMSVTTFAADSATITVTGAEPKVDADGNKGPEATFTYAQVIRADQTTTTGWQFCRADIRDKYIVAFGTTEEALGKMSADEKEAAGQSVLEQMTEIKTEENGVAVSASVSKALAGVAAIEPSIFGAMSNPQTVYEAGVYAIRPMQTGFTYSDMAAYVGFGPVNAANYPDLTDATLAAKRVETSFTKSNADADKVVAVGDEITFTIRTNVPYFSPSLTDTKYVITDTITGAEYVTDPSSYTITMSGKDLKEKGAAITWGTGDKANTFTVDLSSQVFSAANEHVGKPVEITYKAKVTAVDTIENKAKAGNVSNDSIYGTEITDQLYTGEITMLKYGDGNKDNVLAGAGFAVKTSSGENAAALAFREAATGSYIYVKEADVVKAADGTETVTIDKTSVPVVREVVTADNGTVVVKGLDAGTYYFEEKTAPKGYSVNAEEKIVELKLPQGADTATANLTANTDMNDTKLASLPSTGGIGTTIFTIGGCAIMIAAAGLYFSLRRRTEK